MLPTPIKTPSHLEDNIEAAKIESRKIHELQSLCKSERKALKKWGFDPMLVLNQCRPVSLVLSSDVLDRVEIYSVLESQPHLLT